VASDELRERFARTAEQLAEHEERTRVRLRERLERFLAPRGDERALDGGVGTGSLAFALSPLVHEVVGVDVVPEMLEQARARLQQFPNVSLAEGDIRDLPFSIGSFDIAGCLNTLHHVVRSELAVAELTRVTRPGGAVLIIDQVAPVDPPAAVELNRFERARDPSTTRVLADVDFRGLFEANGLVLRRVEFEREDWDLERYLDLAGCEGDAREHARGLAPSGYTRTTAWYLLAKPDFSA
jgi:ubiquinone/menaquinone biosynthesis C-methylase UbiE